MEKKKGSYNENWQKEYSWKIQTTEQAVSHIQPGNRVFIGSGCGQPRDLIKAMIDRHDELTDTEIIDFLTTDPSIYADKDIAGKFRINSFFIADGARSTIQAGLGDYTPIFLSDIPQLFSSGRLPVDVALIQVTPPDNRGRCSFGISVDIAKSVTENASLVIAQVNPLMPRTHGDSSIHIHNIDILVPNEAPLLEVPLTEPDEETKKIGGYIAALIEDGSTIEFGIGSIPQAIAGFLKNKKQLGIHTEMFTDAIIDLIEDGVLDGSRKSMDKGKVVASFCMGTRKLYDYIDNNPNFAFYPTEYVNDPFIISKQTKQVAINVALEVDLTGQVCADSIGTQFYSGIGGQVDFNRGAAKSIGGKAIIALHSTAKNYTISRIKSLLTTGAGVVTTRGDVHYVVTEYGTAYLHGKSVKERAVALISIAHPKFREQLLAEALQIGLLSQDFAGTASGFYLGFEDFYSTGTLEDGTLIHYRTIRPTDEPALKDLFYALSQETIYYRFMERLKSISKKQIKNFIYINPRTDVAIVATIPEAQGDVIIGVGRYYLDQKENVAEVAFLTHDKWQNKGIGTMLLEKLTAIAKRNAISGFSAEVLHDNIKMQRVLDKCDAQTTITRQENVLSYRLMFK